MKKMLAVVDTCSNRRAVARLSLIAAALLAATIIVPISIVKATAPAKVVDTKDASTQATRPVTGPAQTVCQRLGRAIKVSRELAGKDEEPDTPDLKQAAATQPATQSATASTTGPVSGVPTVSVEAQTFAWFDGLGFPDLKGLKLVKVATGQWSQSGNSPPKNRYVMGFLLKDEGKRFTVFTTGLSTTSFTKTSSGQPEHLHVSYEEVDLGKEAADLAQNLQKARDENDSWRPYRKLVSDHVGLFVVARACAANGLDGTAHDLYEQAGWMPGSWCKGPADLPKKVYYDIALSMMHRALCDFGDPSIPRTQLLSTFRQFVKNYPDSMFAQEARDTVGMLEKMVREDEEHAKQPTTAPDKMTQQQRITELIFQLRDQKGVQMSMPGECNIFGDPRDEKSPARQLDKIGYEAVGQLIQAFSDERFTRSVDYGGGMGGPIGVLRISDGAKQIVSAIAGRRFEDAREIETWWAEFQKQGEKKMLQEATARGDRNSSEQARLLVKKYPDAALDVLIQGASDSKDTWVRTDLVRLGGTIAGDDPVPFLINILKSDSAYQCRVVAAEALHRRNRPEGARVIIDLWNRSGASTQPAGGGFDSDPANMINFLLSCKSVDAIHALGKDLGRRPVGLKLAVASAMTSGHWIDDGRAKPADTQLQRKAVDLASQDLLVNALTDTDRSDSTSTWSNCNCVDPRVCDLAACALSRMWPDEYKFDSGVNEFQRDRQRFRLMNIWRKEHRQPLLPVPEPVKITPAAPSVLDPMIKALLDAKTPDERVRAGAAIEALGLPALKPIQEYLAKMKRDDPAYAALDGTGRRLANVVREIVVEKDSLQPSASLQKALDAVKGKPLTSTGYINIVLAAAKDVPVEVTGFRVRAERTQELTGIVLTLRLFRDSAGNKSSSVNANEFISAGGRAILSCCASGPPRNFWNAGGNGYRGFAEAADMALNSATQDPLLLRLILNLSE